MDMAEMEEPATVSIFLRAQTSMLLTPIPPGHFSVLPLDRYPGEQTFSGSMGGNSNPVAAASYTRISGYLDMVSLSFSRLINSTYEIS